MKMLTQLIPGDKPYELDYRFILGTLKFDAKIENLLIKDLK